MPLSLTRDARLLFATRSVRMAGYRALSVVLVLYLARLGFDGPTIGILLTLTLLGDTALSLPRAQPRCHERRLPFINAEVNH